MITNKTLIKLREEMIQEFIKMENKSLPEPLFINGNFNENNWMGGDNILRHFGYYLEDIGNEIIKSLYQCDLYPEEDEDNYSMVPIYFMAKRFHFNEETYILINIHQDGSNEFATYTMKWYKCRGRIDHVTFNGKLITEEQYLKLLNFIQDYKIYDFKINK